MTPLPETRESLLVRLAQPNDDSAWQDFLRCYEPAVLRYARNHGLHEVESREVGQEVLLVVHRQVAQWRPSGVSGSFRHWLLRVTHHHCLKAIAARYRPGRSVGGSDFQEKVGHIVSPSHDSAADEREWQRWAFGWAAERVKLEVDPTAWRAFWLTAVEAIAPRDVAQQLGIRVGTVYTQKCRVLARIRQCVAQLSRDEHG